MTPTVLAQRQCYLILQGCTSPFFARLGDRLRAAGHAVHRINFNMGDAVYWRRSAWSFRGCADELPAFLEPLCAQYGFTDVIMLGDTRRVHAEALPLMRRFGIRIHVLEEGYFRPNWLTLEDDGINGHSSLPCDPDWYREATRLVPRYGDGESVKNPLPILALHELGYHVPNALNPVFYPGYRTHRPHVSPVELFGWAQRFAQRPLHEYQDRRTIARLLGEQGPLYMLPMQLESDSQLRVHSDFNCNGGLLGRVIASFATHAPSDSRLVIKNHPLDIGLSNFRRKVRRLAQHYDVVDRVYYLETGHMPTLLDATTGVVTINSSVGTSALIHRVPLIALGDAVYDVPGLTFQGPLDRFWRDAESPDKELFRAFRDIVIHVSQINGGFYTRRGIDLGAENCVQRVTRRETPLQSLLRATTESQF